METQKGNWRQVFFPDNPPSRIGCGFTNFADQRTLLFGGINSLTGYLEDTWSFDSIQWDQLQISSSPFPRYGMGFGWDRISQKIIIFGGKNNDHLLGDTWLFDGNNWLIQDPLISPPPRMNSCLDCHLTQKQIILFGGKVNNGTKYLHNSNDTWIWNGYNWSQQFPVDSPPIRSNTNLVYDQERDYLLMFGGEAGGGCYDDTWIWNGMNWIQQHSNHSPSNRMDFGLVFHEEKRTVVLFGGQTTRGIASDTWVWDGIDWTQLQVVQSPPIQVANGAKLAYIPNIETVVLYNAYKEKVPISDESSTMIDRSEFWVLEY